MDATGNMAEMRQAVIARPSQAKHTTLKHGNGALSSLVPPPTAPRRTQKKTWQTRIDA